MNAKLCTVALVLCASGGCNKEDVKPQVVKRSAPSVQTVEVQPAALPKAPSSMEKLLGAKRGLGLREGQAAPLLAKAVERRLYSEAVEASSFLWVNFNRFQENYHPSYAMDGDPKTAWTEGTEGDGVGQWIRVRSTPIRMSTKLRLRIQNGYHKSESLFRKNARVRELELVSLASGVSKRFTLQDSMDWQEIELPLQDETFEGFELRVESVYPGSKYSDLCISDLEVLVTGRGTENPKFETRKLQRLLDWKKERVEAARIFQSAAGRELPVKSGYRVSRGMTLDATKPALANLQSALATPSPILQRAKQALDSKFAGWKHHRIVVKNASKVPNVDGLHTAHGDEPAWMSSDSKFMLPGVKGKSLLQAQSISLFEAKTAGFEASNGDECVAGELHALRPPEGKGPTVEQLLLWRCVQEEEREGVYNYLAWQLLEYDQEGWLTLSLTAERAQYLEWQEQGAGRVLVGGLRANAGGNAIARLETEEKQKLH